MLPQSGLPWASRALGFAGRALDKVQSSSGRLGTSASVSLATIIGQGSNALVPIVTATVIGATAATDGFFLAFSLVTLGVTALTSLTQFAAVPYLIDWLGTHRDGAEVSGAFLRATLLTTTAVAITLVLVGPLVLVHSGLSGDARHAWSVAIWGLLPYLFAASAAGYWSGLLTAEAQFLPTAISPLVRTAVVVTMVVLVGGRWGVWALVAGYAAGEVLRAEVLRRQLAPALGAVHIVGSVRMPAGYRHFLRTAIAQVLSAAVLALTAIIDRVMVADLGQGAISVLEYAERLWQVPTSLLLAGYLVVSLTAWSRQHQATGDSVELARAVRRAASRVFCLLLIPCLAVAALHDSVILAPFGGSGLGAAELTALARVLRPLVIITPVFAAGLVYVRALFVLRRSDLLLGISITQTLIKVALNVVLIPAYGLAGAALATCAMYVASTLLVIVLFHGVAVAKAERLRLT